MNIKFYIKKNSKSPSADEPLYCFIRHRYEEKAFFTGQRIPPKYWDSRKQAPKKGFPEEALFNDFLANYKATVKKIILEVQAENPSASFKEIVSVIESRMQLSQKNPVDFFAVFDLYIEHLRVNTTHGYVKKFLGLRNILVGFHEQTKLVSFNKLSGRNIVVWFDKFKEYLADVVNHQVSTLRKDILCIRGFLNWANERGHLHNLDISVLSNIDVPSDPKKAFVSLSYVELRSIMTCKLDERLDKIRDLFLFQLYTGQRYSDVLSFSEVQVDKKTMVWSLRQQKGGAKRSIIKVPLIDAAINILVKYNYLLPVLSLDKYNNSLKDIAKIAGIDELCTSERIFLNGTVETTTFKKYELITSHTARRTFATLSIYSGIDKKVIKSYTGHSTDKMLDHYFQDDPIKNKALIESVFAFDDAKLN
jgi:integrase